MKSFLKLSAVLDQTSDAEFQLMSRAEADDCFKVYDMHLGGAPPDDQEPTVALLSAMKHVVTHGCVPYADFGVFGLRLTGLMLGPSGELFRSEMAGPMTYDQWEACFMVFRSAMVMLEFASPSSLDGYGDHVRQYSTRFVTQCWALIYQTDTRARREHAERLRRRANAELTALDAIGVKGACMSSGSCARVYKYDDQGLYKCNRRGVQLCVAFQTGSCSSPCPQQMAHQCKICLYATHGAKDCPKAGTSVPQQARHGANKGKGMKQKGKKGKKFQW